MKQKKTLKKARRKTGREAGRKSEVSKRGMVEERETEVTQRSHRSCGTTKNNEEKEDIRKLRSS
jgi:hypothetical protein